MTEVESVATYNLWNEPWITVESEDGSLTEMGIEAVLLHAHALDNLYDPSPLVFVGIHRLLVAILQDILAPKQTQELAAVWDAGRFPTEALHAFGKQYRHRFDLFARENPFLQSADLPLQPAKKPKPKTVAYLRQEQPARTAVVHYNHSYDDDEIYCATCAAKGLVTLPAFASSGGSGIKPSINGVPPIYIIPGGKTLFESLAASLVTPNHQPPVADRKDDRPWWRHEPVVPWKSIVRQVGYLQSLTFPVRRVRLHPIPLDRPCSLCGRRTEHGVRTMIYGMGESRPKDAAFWQDPFAAYRLPGGRSQKDPTPIRPVEGRATWREFTGLFLPDRPEEEDRRHLRPLLLDQLERLAQRYPTVLPYGDETPFPFRTVGLRTDMKMKLFEWQEDGFAVPPAILSDYFKAEIIEQGLEYATGGEKILKRTFKEYFGGDTADQHHEPLRERMTRTYWQQLADPFRHAVLELGKVEDPARVLDIWLNTVQQEALAAFGAAAAQVGDDAANLRRRVEGNNHCRARLIAYRKKQFGSKEEG